MEVKESITEGFIRLPSGFAPALRRIKDLSCAAIHALRAQCKGTWLTV